MQFLHRHWHKHRMKGQKDVAFFVVPVLLFFLLFQTGCLSAAVHKPVITYDNKGPLNIRTQKSSFKRKVCIENTVLFQDCSFGDIPFILDRSGVKPEKSSKYADPLLLYTNQKKSALFNNFITITTPFNLFVFPRNTSLFAQKTSLLIYHP